MSTTEAAAVQVAPRPPLLAQGLASALLAAALLGLATLGHLPLLGGVVVVQLVAAIAFLALVDAPSPGGVLVVAAGAAVAADVVVVVQDGEIGGLAGVVALSLVASLFHQLSRRQRNRVTESLADTLAVVVLISAAACLPAALQVDEWPVRAALAAGGAALLVGRLVDVALRRPVLVAGATRAWPGLVLALAAGVGTALMVADGHLTEGQAALLGLAAAATVAAVDLAIDLAGGTFTAAGAPTTPAAPMAATLRPAGALTGGGALAPPGDARKVAALRPAGLFVPFAMLGPVTLLAVRLIGS